MAYFAELTSTRLFIAMITGFLPPLLWLWFWLKEDKRHPEPRRALIRTFCYGLTAAFVALPVEYFVSTIAKNWFFLFASWAFIEELFKYIAAKRSALRKNIFDEPIDAVIYMVTAALGFAAFENILFLVQNISATGILSSVVTGNLRFLGATLLHTATSAVVGGSIAYSFFHPEKRHRNVIGGIILATILHFMFNFYILKNSGVGVFKVFIPLWVGIIAIIFLFERVKNIRTA